jgi:hypothetical protein
MTLTAEERSAFTKRLVLVSIVTSLLVSLFGVYLWIKLFSRHQPGTNNLVPGSAEANMAAGNLNTPIVLVGDSLIFKSDAQSNNPPWTPTPGTNGSDYYLDPGYSISTIAVKQKAPPDGKDDPNTDDADPTTDKISVGIPSGSSSTWQIDAYTTASGKVASITPGPGTQIHLVVTTGNLCPNATSTTSKKIKYGLASGCTDNPAFSQVNILIDSVQVGSLNCDDASGTQNKCRIVLKGAASVSTPK